MLQFNTAKLKLEVEFQNMVYTDVFELKQPFRHSLYTVTPITIRNKHGIRVKIEIKPISPIRILNAVISMDCSLKDTDSVFLNGYQSWTDSWEIPADARLKSISGFARLFLKKYKLNRYGDYDFVKYTNRRGDLHAFTYSYIRSRQALYFSGSLNENNGFTIISYSLADQKMYFKKDLDGGLFNDMFDMFDLFFMKGDNLVFDRYFEYMQIPTPVAKISGGWTSWYNYYQNISEEIILSNLRNFEKENIPIDYFQIDDGYQKAVGDWLTIHPRFPNGMKNIALQIKEAGYKPGIWIAPFVCETKSDIFCNHKDWILTDENGKMVPAAGSWSGAWALNLENEHVLKYLHHVFDTMLNNWDFELIKIDFLYAACIIPYANKTRAQLMTRAWSLIKEWVGDKKQILACGTPLAQAFGNAHFCRTGCDVDLQWDNKFYRKILHRERISTLESIKNTIGRNWLNNLAFLNDPDVFILRSTNTKLTAEQSETLFLVNHIFGSLLFTSDNIAQYTAEQRDLYLKSFPLREKDIISVVYKNVVLVVFNINDLEYFAAINLTGKIQDFYLPRGEYYNPGAMGWISGNIQWELKPYQSVCLLKQCELYPAIAGSTSHIFPGSEIEELKFDNHEITIKLYPQVRRKGEVYIQIPKANNEIVVNNELLKARFIDGKKIVTWLNKNLT